MTKRVVITGLGVITPIGLGKKEFWKGLKDGQNGVVRITRFDASSFPSQIAGEVKNFNPTDYIEKREVKKMDRFTQYAVAAAKLAVEDSGIPLDRIRQDRAGVIVGSGIGGLETIEAQHKALLERGPRRISPFLVPMLIANMASGYISIIFGLKGPNITVVTACATATHSIGEAYRILERGEADIMFAGGAESAITPLAVGGFCAARALSINNEQPSKASRPFDKKRDGFVIGEGAGVIILETLEHALERGAHIYAELIGYGMSGDAYHVTAPDPEGLGAFRCMQNALNDAGIDGREVDYINAHGTSTEFNDKIETMAIKKTFKEHAYKLAISSTKSMIGHLLGAAGAVELVATLMAFEEGIIHPTINYEYPDPDCDLDYVPNKARKAAVNTAISNSFGFGGTNASLVVRRYV
ncbi:MAG: beta-ketoacyl-ACP synthase II [Dethiobacteria bacterium]|jgi:3-oxoacyl-[acyl-carrier-protein] synthase II